MRTTWRKRPAGKKAGLRNYQLTVLTAAIVSFFFTLGEVEDVSVVSLLIVISLATSL